MHYWLMEYTGVISITVVDDDRLLSRSLSDENFESKTKVS